MHVGGLDGEMQRGAAMVIHQSRIDSFALKNPENSVEQFLVVEALRLDGEGVEQVLSLLIQSVDNLIVLDLHEKGEHKLELFLVECIHESASEVVAVVKEEVGEAEPVMADSDLEHALRVCEGDLLVSVVVVLDLIERFGLRVGRNFLRLFSFHFLVLIASADHFENLFGFRMHIVCCAGALLHEHDGVVVVLVQQSRCQGSVSVDISGMQICTTVNQIGT